MLESGKLAAPKRAIDDLDRLPTAETSEQVLLQRLEQGDRGAFWQLWIEHRDYLEARSLQWMGGNPQDAEEVLSEAQLKAWKQLPEQAGKIANFRGWLTRLTYNLCIDRHREGRRKGRETQSMEAMTEELAWGETPEAAIERRELDLYISQAIDLLPENLRTAFGLRYYQQKSYQEMAKELGLSSNNLRKRIQRARKILQQQLNQYLYSWEHSSSLNSPPSRGVLISEPAPAWEATLHGETTMGEKPVAE